MQHRASGIPLWCVPVFRRQLVERTREGNDLYHEMMQAGIVKPGDPAGLQSVALIYGQMNEPPGARARKKR